MTLAEIAVVACPVRRARATELIRRVGASCIAWDRTKVGAAANHLQAWSYLVDTPAPWAVVLEDDAVPCIDFVGQLDAMLAVAPGDFVSLYLGRGRPDQWQLPISAAISHDACFLRADALLGMVGYAVRPELLRRLLTSIRFRRLRHPRARVELNDQVSDWMRNHGLSIFYSRPSLVDHADGPPVIADAEREDGQSRAMAPHPSGTAIRRAWLFDWEGRECWDSSWAQIPRPDLRRRDKVSRRRSLSVVR